MIDDVQCNGGGETMMCSVLDEIMLLHPPAVWPCSPELAMALIAPVVESYPSPRGCRVTDWMGCGPDTVVFTSRCQHIGGTRICEALHL